MDKYFVVVVTNQYFDIWDNSLTNNLTYARLYDSISDLKNDCISLKDYAIKEIIFDDEFNLISEKVI